jgi:hypothetical protein
MNARHVTVEMSQNFAQPFTVVHRDTDYAIVDTYRSREIAVHYARMLNDGRAVVRPHATAGCRVQVVTDPSMGVEAEVRLGWALIGPSPDH